MTRRWLTPAVVVLLIGCSHDSKVATESVAPQQASRNFGRLPAVLAGLRQPAEIRLCEGLPGEFWEPELREQELARKETTRINGYLFYKESIELNDKDAGELASLLSSKKTFKTYRDNKRCGGFQPDYGVIWKQGEATTHVLISLECGEVKMFGPQADLHCDLGREAGEKLGLLLARYRKNRPTESSGA